MANEYLERTPTANGNRKTFTWSVWVKRNQLGTNQNLFCSTAPGVISKFLFDTDDKLNYQNNSPNFQLVTEQEFKDTGSWIHILFVADTTASVESERINIYVNGSKVTEFATETYPALDSKLIWNYNIPHFISKESANVNYAKCQFFDIFHVDGQALTPDVFGYHKKGNGYVSAGSTEATEFREGQWLPKAPKVIKSVINSRGNGFGANGFYLPMNDSTNAGADNHCNLNTIIKLKGEDEQQPYYGAPTTSDNYVSQLRDDPLKDYLVFAMPGISTSTSSNVVTNGDFNENVNNWTAEANATITHNEGAMRVTVTATAGATQTVNQVDGQRYTLTFKLRTDGTNFANVALNHSGGKTDYLGLNINSTQWLTYSASFVADGTSVTLKPYKATGGWFEIDDIVYKQEDAPKDYSADIKGSGTNKTIVPSFGSGYAAPAVTYNVPSFYGSAVGMNSASGDIPGLLLGWGEGDPDYIFDGDFTMEAWVYLNETPSAYWSIFRSKNYNDQVAKPEAGIAFYGRENFIRIWDRNGTTNDLNSADAGSIPLRQWTHVALCRHNTTLRTFCNGVCVATKENNVTYQNNGFEIGQSFEWFGFIQDARIYKGVAKYKSGFDVARPFKLYNFINNRHTIPDSTENNFAILNGAAKGSKYTLTEGNLRFTNSTNNWNTFVEGTVGFSTGKWYWETRADVDTDYHHIGIIGVGITNHNAANTYFYGMSYQSDGRLWSENNAGGPFATNKTHANLGDIVQVAVDMNDKKMWIGINGNWIDGGDPATGTTENFNATVGFGYQHYVPFYDSYGSSGLSINFGQNPTFGGKKTAGTNTDDNGKGLFFYDVPAGYLSLCEDNLPTPEVADPSKHMKTVLYNGNGANGRSVTGVGFQPDFVWIKERTSTSSHQLHDSVRGAGNLLISSETNAEAYSKTYLNTFDSDGFTLGTSGGVNSSSDKYVAWCWKAGGPAVPNTNGSITSQVSANPTAGFSIVSYTGTGANATVGHGLGKPPKFIMVKNREDSGTTGATNGTWKVYHGSLPANMYLTLNDTSAATVDDSVSTTGWNNTRPTNDVFSLGNFNSTNGSGDDMIAYCWAEIEGYSKIGSYYGSGNTQDNTFVYCGFKPAWIMIKGEGSGDLSWAIYDSSRDPINVVYHDLAADQSIVEATKSYNAMDFVSNGFKIRQWANWLSLSTQRYYFIAFAESPFKTANAK